MRTTSIVLLSVFASAMPLSAQSWESPTFFAPRPGEDIGVYFVFPDDFYEWGIAGIWRTEGNLNLGVRVGYMTGDFDDLIQVGAEFYGPLNLLGPGSELLMAWRLGLGASFDDVTTLRIPLGVSIGTILGSTGSLRLQPYVFPRVTFDVFTFDDIDGDEETITEFELAVDVGADMNLGPSWVLRGGVTFDTAELLSETTFGVGLAYRFGRRLVVR